MEAFLSFILIVLITAGWLLVVSYADYLTATHIRNISKLGQGKQPDLSLRKLLGLPWSWLQWSLSGMVVLGLSIVLALPGPLFLFIVAACGLIILAAMAWTDSSQVRQSDADLEGWAPIIRPRPISVSTSSAKLYGLHGEYKGQILGCSHNTLIGRSHRCDIQLSEKQVSDQHARIVFTHGNWYIQDQNSKAGTFVDGLLVSAGQLQHGTKIRIHRSEFEFRIE